jgi:hypothetical protein
MLWFFLITTIYFVVKYSTEGQNIVYFGIYALLLIIGEYFINLSLTNAMCGSNQFNTAIFVTLIPWVFIFGILNLVLSVFPGWLAPFSNTFGYGITKLMGINTILNDIFKPKIVKGDLGGEKMAEALEHIYSDKSLLINEVTPANFETFWENMTPLFQAGVEKNTVLKNSLLNMVRLKDIISEYIWYMLTGVLVTSVGYNYVVNSGCTQSIKEMKKRNKDYEDQMQTTADTTATATPRVYSSQE